MGQFVGEAVRSVLQQEDVALEVVVVDDGSTDNTQGELEVFRPDPRVQVIAQGNRGQPRAKNAGVEAARGEFIAFCDADDYWLPGKLAVQLPLFAENPSLGVVCSSAYTLYPDGSMDDPSRSKRKFYRGRVLGQLFRGNIVPFGTAVVRRECFEQHGGFNESIPMGIDWELWLRYALHWEFDFVTEPTYVYRVWGGQMSKNLTRRYECALEIMDSFLAQYPRALSRGTVSAAYAETYTNFANLQYRTAGRSEAVATLRKALAHRFLFTPAWKALVRMAWRELRQSREGKRAED